MVNQRRALAASVICLMLLAALLGRQSFIERVSGQRRLSTKISSFVMFLASRGDYDAITNLDLATQDVVEALRADEHQNGKLVDWRLEDVVLRPLSIPAYIHFSSGRQKLRYVTLVFNSPNRIDDVIFSATPSK